MERMNRLRGVEERVMERHLQGVCNRLGVPSVWIPSLSFILISAVACNPQTPQLSLTLKAPAHTIKAGHIELHLIKLDNASEWLYVQSNTEHVKYSGNDYSERWRPVQFGCRSATYYKKG